MRTRDWVVVVLLQTIYALALFAYQSYLKAAIENTVKFEFREREQAALVASLFAEWIADPKDKKELNRLTWEATLWLPDDLALDVNKRLANNPDARNIREILVEIKGLMHGGKSTLDWRSIVAYPNKTDSN